MEPKKTSPPWSWLLKHNLFKTHTTIIWINTFQLPKGKFQTTQKKRENSQDSDSANSHVYSPYRNEIWKKIPWTPKETEKTSMFCKRAVSKGLDRPEVLMTMVSLFDVYIPQKQWKYCFCFDCQIFFFQFPWAFPYIGNLCGHITKNCNEWSSKWQSHWGFWTRPNYKLESPCRWMTMACCSRCSKIECTWR